MKILCLFVLALGPVLSPTRGEERVFDESMLSQGITGDLLGRINVALAATRDESERLRLQFRIWETVFGHVLTTNDSNFVQQIRDLGDLIPLFTRFDNCTPDGRALKTLGDHLGRMSCISTNGLFAECRQAYDEDKKLCPVEKRGVRETGCGRPKNPGPNWLAWSRRYSKVNSWNREISRYRRTVFYFYGRFLDYYFLSKDEVAGPLFVREFSTRARLSDEERRQLFPTYREDAAPGEKGGGECCAK